MKFWGIFKNINKKKAEEKEDKTCDLSQILDKFGNFQVIQYMLICLTIIFCTLSNINYIVIAGDLEYRCRVDECEDANSTAEHPSWWPDANIDRCSTPVLKSGEQVCTNNSFTGELATCDHWIYESNDTVVAELNLACQPWNSNLIGTIHGAGWLISMGLFGWIADKIGRKPVIIFTGVACCIGFFKTFATSYYTFITIEFLEALGAGGNASAAMVLLLEFNSKKHRSMSGIIYTYSVYLGECLLACIAMYVPYWKTIVSIIYGPCVLFLFYIFVLKESYRWQLLNDKTHKAKKTLKHIAKMNKIPLSCEELENIDEAEIKEKLNIARQEIKETVIDILRSKEIIKRFLVTCVLRFTNSFVYYGLMLNAVWLPGNKYLNLFLTTLMSFLGELFALYLVYKVGRKTPLIAGYSLCGVLCIISAVIPASYPWLKLASFFLGKIAISACFSSLITYIMELFPTSVRGTLLGISGFFPRLANLGAPLTVMLNSIFYGFPFVLFGGSVIISSLLLMLTPETKNLPLFDTIKQIEGYHKDDCSMETETKSA